MLLIRMTTIIVCNNNYIGADKNREYIMVLESLCLLNIIIPLFDRKLNTIATYLFLVEHTIMLQYIKFYTEVVKHILYKYIFIEIDFLSNTFWLYISILVKAAY